MFVFQKWAKSSEKCFFATHQTWNQKMEEPKEEKKKKNFNLPNSNKICPLSSEPKV